MERYPFSIVIPTGDRRPYLRAALADLVAQGFPADSYEIVVVDDTDAGVSRPLVEEAARSTDVRVTYVPRTGQPGPNAARNTGIKHSTGDVVAFVDDDCRFDRTWLAALAAGIDAAPDAECYGGPITVALDGGHPRWCGREPFPITSLDHGPVDRWVDVVYSANFAIPRRAFERVGRFREDQPIYGDETEWVLRLRRRDGLVRYVAAARADHTRLPGDVTVKRMLVGAHLRGRNVEAWDRAQGLEQPLGPALRRALRMSAHAVRRRCWVGAAHAAEYYSYLYHFLRRAPSRRRARVRALPSG